MSEETPRTYESAGGDGLLLIVATAVIVVVIGEAAFVAYPSLLLLPFAILGALVVTALVIYAAMRTMENDAPIAPLPKPKPRTQPEPAATAVRARPIAH
jgi:hypothetical protein